MNDKDIKGGMLVIRLFLIIVFGLAGSIGVMILIREIGAWFFKALLCIFCCMLYGLVLILLAAIAGIMEKRIVEDPTVIHAFPESVKANSGNSSKPANKKWRIHWLTLKRTREEKK